MGCHISSAQIYSYKWVSSLPSETHEVGAANLDVAALAAFSAVLHPVVAAAFAGVVGSIGCVVRADAAHGFQYFRTDASLFRTLSKLWQRALTTAHAQIRSGEDV